MDKFGPVPLGYCHFFVFDCLCFYAKGGADGGGLAKDGAEESKKLITSHVLLVKALEKLAALPMRADGSAVIPVGFLDDARRALALAYRISKPPTDEVGNGMN